MYAVEQVFIFVDSLTFDPDAVVLWDWLTSLDREWRFVHNFSFFRVLGSSFSRSGRPTGLQSKSRICSAGMSIRVPPIVCPSTCSYWVIGVVPYLLYCFVGDHTLEKCQRIYRVKMTFPLLIFYLTYDYQIPVALAMWNQVGSECEVLPFFLYAHLTSISRPSHPHLCLLQSECLCPFVSYRCPWWSRHIPALCRRCSDAS